jgi:hypothetical protein
MLRAVRAALAAGIAPSEIEREPDFAAYLDDRDLRAVLASVTAPAIPLDVAPHVPSVRAALDSLIATLRELGEQSKLSPPAKLERIVAVERVRSIQLPNDYRALLTLSDGMRVWDHEFFGTADYRTETTLAQRARTYIEMSAGYGLAGIEDCVPLASWGQPNDWLFYDPRGTLRGDRPGYVLILTADPRPLEDLIEVLDHLETIVRDVLGTN